MELGWSYVARITDNRWTTRITFWTPQGHTRNQDRPRTTWRDELESFVKHCHRVAQNVVPVEVGGEGPTTNNGYSKAETKLNWFNLSTCITFLHHYVPYKIRD